MLLLVLASRVYDTIRALGLKWIGFEAPLID